MIWFFYIYEFAWITPLWEQPRRKFALHKSDLAAKAKSKKNAPSALISISKQSIVLRNQCVAQLGLIFSGPCVGCFWGKGGKKKKEWGWACAVRAASHPCGTCRKIISTITWWKRKCNLRKSTVKEHLRPQQAVPEHMLLRCFQQCSFFSPCRRKASIYSRPTFNGSSWWTAALLS